MMYGYAASASEWKSGYKNKGTNLSSVFFTKNIKKLRDILFISILDILKKEV